MRPLGYFAYAGPAAPMASQGGTVDWFRFWPRTRKMVIQPRPSNMPAGATSERGKRQSKRRNFRTELADRRQHVAFMSEGFSGALLS
jgi:hypothetical protein